MTPITQNITNWIIALGSVFFSSISGTNASFMPPNIQLDHDRLLISAQLTDWYTPELDQILASGQEITISYHLTVSRQLPSDSLIQTVDFSHHLKYDLVDRVYMIDLSEFDQHYQIVSLDGARMLLGSIRKFPLINTEQLDWNASYQYYIDATMQSIEFSGFSKTINLMNFWRGKKPKHFSSLFRKSQFVS